MNCILFGWHQDHFNSILLPPPHWLTSYHFGEFSGGNSIESISNGDAFTVNITIAHTSNMTHGINIIGNLNAGKLCSTSQLSHIRGYQLCCIGIGILHVWFYSIQFSPLCICVVDVRFRCVRCLFFQLHFVFPIILSYAIAFDLLALDIKCIMNIWCVINVRIYLLSLLLLIQLSSSSIEKLPQYFRQRVCMCPCPLSSVHCALACAFVFWNAKFV